MRGKSTEPSQVCHWDIDENDEKAQQRLYVQVLACVLRVPFFHSILKAILQYSYYYSYSNITINKTEAHRNYIIWLKVYSQEKSESESQPKFTLLQNYFIQMALMCYHSLVFLGTKKQLVNFWGVGICVALYAQVYRWKIPS